MEYKYKDVFEFQEKFKTKEEREKKLMKMSYEEIWHLAHTCATPQGGVYYGQFAKLALEREQAKKHG